MTSNPKNVTPSQGPFSYENWQAAISGQPILAGVEFPLYSDARFIGSMRTDLRPYQFFNLLAYQPTPGLSRAAVVLRVAIHIKSPDMKMSETDQSRYHGGTMVDEIAALASLCLGARIRAGGQNREFSSSGDPKGEPMAWDFRPEPDLRIGFFGRVLPSVAGEHNLFLLSKLSWFPKIKPEDAVALVRAARLYQNALWIAEADPNLGWLLLVSAVEAVAKQWKSEKGTPLDRLCASRPQFISYLEELNVEGLSTRVAEEFKDSIGSTKTFVDFLGRHAPSPPQHRPPDGFQFSFEDKNLCKILRLIYDYRSKALHTAIPFPAPMCMPPFRDPKWEAPSELPTGRATSYLGGTWLVEDTPIQLHMFEYVVRGSLLLWWESLLNCRGQAPT